MIYSGFFDDKTYYAKSLNQAIAGLISNGILGTKASNLQVTANSGMTISIKPGYCWIDGCHMLNDNDYVLTIATADGVLKRIDRIVARKDMVTGNISPIILKGDLSDAPVPPDIVNDGTYHDLGLATITVNAGTTAITQDMITDTRFDENICGVVTGLANFIDTTGLFAQYDAIFTAFMAENLADAAKIMSDSDTELQSFMTSSSIAFSSWFSNVKNQLSTDVAGHLQNEIDEINTAIIPVPIMQAMIFNNISANPYIILFDNLDGVTATGTYNSTLKRLEC